LIAGKFTTLHGTEVIASSGNTNISRSILFGSGAVYPHRRARDLGSERHDQSHYRVNNGWDQLTDSNKGKTAELG